MPILTLLGARISPAAEEQTRALLIRHGIRPLKTRRLHGAPTPGHPAAKAYHRIDLLLPPPPFPPSFRNEMDRLARRLRLDWGFQWTTAKRRVLILDIDSTLIRNETIDELAKEKGVYRKVAAITREAMKGNLVFDESLRQRCALLRGLEADKLDRVYRRLRLTRGARQLLQGARELGFTIGLISGGFTFAADRLKNHFGLDYAFANRLEIRRGRLTGIVTPPVVNARRKAALLRHIAKRAGARLDEVVAIGDGANDLVMLAQAGLGIAFHAKPIVREKADFPINRRKSLDSALWLLTDSERALKKITARRTEA